ncbi:MAG: 4Fe-4S dicluster domain-containing protein [Bacteroidetes bacterium]|nr:4Fe-4S dicluster domain-containing protein [Bacteroidota bacterium]MBL6944657.1 4Fe-4S dicluster domain-containing protein [Bacteroidales bacterium]
MNITNFIIIELLLIISAIVIFAFFTYAAIISFIEKEKKAALIFFMIGVLASMSYLYTGFFDFKYQFLVSIILLSLIIGLLLIYFIPIRFTANISDVFPKDRIDERNTIFSRNELHLGSENFNYYYQKNPDKLKIDDAIKNNPGVLSPESRNYDPAMFSSADASFETVAIFKNKVDGKVSSQKINLNPEKISTYIKNWAKKLGALNVGITELKDYHSYSYRGRGENYGNKVVLDHKFAIAFTVEMDYDAVKSGPYGPAVMESAQQYLASGVIAIQIAKFIRQIGFPARAHIDGNYEVVCPLVAKDAGLGEIGRMGLLMTPKLGPRVRIAVVTTDLPLIIDTRKFDPTVIDFCNNCSKCAVVCPSNAISFDERKSINDVKRWQINQDSCYSFWTLSGTDCARCLSVCPYSHPDNLLHNIVRFGIINSGNFSRLTLFLDDIIYGKKPAAKSVPDWMKVS